MKLKARRRWKLNRTKQLQNLLYISKKQTWDAFFFRCLFNIDGLVADKTLQLVGATWLRATTDIYVAFQRIYSAGESVSQWCNGMQGYKGNPSCPAGLSTVVHPGVFVG